MLPLLMLSLPKTDKICKTSGNIEYRKSNIELKIKRVRSLIFQNRTTPIKRPPPVRIRNRSFTFIHEKIQQSSKQILAFKANDNDGPTPLPKRKDENLPKNLESPMNKSKTQVPYLTTRAMESPQFIKFPTADRLKTVKKQQHTNVQPSSSSCCAIW